MALLGTATSFLIFLISAIYINIVDAVVIFNISIVTYLTYIHNKDFKKEKNIQRVREKCCNRIEIERNTEILPTRLSSKTRVIV